MNESERFLFYLEKSDYKINTVNGRSTIKFNECLIDIISDNTIQFERPDIIIKGNDRVILLEHFEFDSSKLIRGASLENKKVAELDRELDKRAKENMATVTTISKPLENKASTKSYISNLIRNSQKHIKKYDDYIANYKTKKTDSDCDVLEFGFIIENTSAIYDMILRKNIPYMFSPFEIEEFLIFLKQHKNINHIFYLCRVPNDYRILYFYNDDESIKEITDNIELVTENDELLFPNPQSISARKYFK